ncbi:hypothetical protein [Microbacterium sp. Leaf151]|uniref:hypothetical protein n=1 Tax=Microbacterium sp. Leaf151 TaxID=1736276 RepID=UPI0006F7FA41|nr:hypothetical protein [Microbacterium sp. Leaf151]KQR26384.1 hypothetical protein ASF76_03860 [Microbacterium sp. Leaf151]
MAHVASLAAVALLARRRVRAQAAAPPSRVHAGSAFQRTLAPSSVQNTPHAQMRSGVSWTLNGATRVGAGSGAERSVA